MTTQILFICTGNYYRSRFAELYFNHLVQAKNLAVVAFSRGLQVYEGKHPGSVSPLTLAYLSTCGVCVNCSIADPRQLSEQDLTQASLVVVLDENEHRPMFRQHFPQWQFEDVHLRPSQQVLPALEQQVMELFNGLLKNATNF